MTTPLNFTLREEIALKAGKIPYLATFRDRFQAISDKLYGKYSLHYSYNNVSFRMSIHFLAKVNFFKIRKIHWGDPIGKNRKI